MKYLLVMHCDEDGYCDTSGHWHWHVPEFFRESEFDIDDQYGLIKAIADFKFKYPKGDLSVYKIEEMTWDDTNDIIKQADPLIESLRLKEKLKAEQEKIMAEKAAAQRQKAFDLEQLKKLQEKYKGEI